MEHPDNNLYKGIRDSVQILESEIALIQLTRVETVLMIFRTKASILPGLGLARERTAASVASARETMATSLL